MEPTIEQLSKQHATIISEVNTLESRIAQLRTDATRIEGVVIYLNQQAAATASPEVTEVEESSVSIAATLGSEEDKAVIVSNPLRRLTYRFLNLSYRVRIDIAQTLDLLQDEDKGLSEVEKFKNFYLRAKRENKLEHFWSEVEKRYSDGDVINPYIDK